MLKILNPTVHGVLDYALAVAFVVFPMIAPFPEPIDGVTMLIGAIYIVVSLLTKYPLSVAKLIPFPLHGILESVMAAVWIAMPWVLGFADAPAARNFYVAAGIGLLAVVVLTDYRSTAGEPVYDGPERRKTILDRRQRALAVAIDRRVNDFDRRRYA